MSGMVADLRGRRILVVEDEYLLADEVAEALGHAGAEVVGPVSRLDEALNLARGEGALDGAILDVNLRGEKIWPVVEVLAGRGVPLVLTTGYDVGVIPAAHSHLVRCEKPVDARLVARLLAQHIGAETRSGGATSSSKAE